MARRLETSRPSSSGSTPIQMVGTPAARVTRSDSMSAARPFGDRSGPGMIRSAPQATAAWARPQALAWNIGTTGSTRSFSVGDSRRRKRHRVQERRPVRVDDALGVAGGAARVAHRRGLVLVPHVELDRRGRGQQLLVVVDLLARRRLVRHLARPVVHDDDVADRVELREQRPHELGQRPVDEDDLVLGVVGHVDELLGEQPDVQRVQHPVGAGRRSTARVAGGVPGEGRHPPSADAEVVEEPPRQRVLGQSP